MSARSKLSLIAVVVVIVCLFFPLWNWSWPALTRPYAATAAPKLSISSRTATDAVVARLWTGSGRVYATCVHDGSDKDCPRVDIAFENKSIKPVTNLRFEDFKTPGFLEDGDCWKDNHPACLAGSESATEVSGTIEAGRSIHLWARIKPAGAIGRYGLLALYSWEQPTGVVDSPNKKHKSDRKRGSADQSGTSPILVQHSGAVTLQPIEIMSPLHEAVGTAEHLLQNLALPIVVAGFAWFFQVFDRTRSERGEVWREQLGRIFEYTQKHYLGISTNVSALERYATDPAYRDRMFYQFAMLWIQVRQLRSEKGGWFFSTREGEIVIARGWRLFSMNVRDHLGSRKGGDMRMDSVADIIKSPESISKFRSRLTAGDADAKLLTALDKDFVAWVDNAAAATDRSFSESLALLSAIAMVLRFEWDRPFYRYWYRENPVFSRTRYQELLTKIPQEPQEEYFEFSDAAKSYSPAKPRSWRVFGHYL